MYANTIKSKGGGVWTKWTRIWTKWTDKCLLFTDKFYTFATQKKVYAHDQGTIQVTISKPMYL